MLCSSRINGGEIFMPRPWLLSAGLLIVSIGLLGAVYEGSLAIGRTNAPNWLVLFLAVSVPVILGKTMDRVWRRIR
jgi:hypothetical protein